MQSKEIPKKAFILAGGKGTRLKPITKEIPKPLLSIQGKPILEHIINLFKKFGITNIIISIGYLGNKIKEFFSDGSRLGVNISYIEEKSPLGTGGPLKLAKFLLNETFFMSNADELKNIDLIAMYRFHKENKAIGTIALTAIKDPKTYGVVKLKGKQIVEFQEKPKTKSTNLINAGLYIFEPEILKYLEKIKKSKISIEKEIFPQLAKDGRLYGYKFEGQWLDAGTPENYEKAIKEWKGL